MEKNIYIFWILITIIIILDVLASTLFKKSVDHKKKNYMYIGLLLFAINDFLFFKLLNYKNVAIATSIWDVTSLVLINLVSVIYFGEHLKIKQKLGILIGIISLVLLS